DFTYENFNKYIRKDAEIIMTNEAWKDSNEITVTEDFWNQNKEDTHPGRKIQDLQEYLRQVRRDLNLDDKEKQALLKGGNIYHPRNFFKKNFIKYIGGGVVLTKEAWKKDNTGFREDFLRK